MRKFSILPFLFVLILATNVYGVEEDTPHDSCSESLASVLVRSEYVIHDQEIAWNHAPTIVETTDGTLICAWHAFYDPNAENLIATNVTWAARKPKGSDHFEPATIVGRALEERLCCMNPTLFQSRTGGPVYLVCKSGWNFETWRGLIQVSTDDGVTWKDRKYLPDNLVGPVKDKPLEIEDNVFLCPSSEQENGWRIHMERFSPKSSEKQWTRTPDLNDVAKTELIQPTLLVHRDGRLQALCRARDQNGVIWTLWSSDKGETWTEPEKTQLPNPNSGIDATTLSDGRFLLVYNHTTSETGGRHILNVAVSDDGKNWNAVCVLENCDWQDKMYPAVVQTRDGLVHIVYSYNWKNIAHVTIDPAKIKGTPIVDGKWPENVK